MSDDRQTAPTERIERIVVPLDAATDSVTAIEAAARLAAHAKAALHGVFVEDEDLLHVAALPFSRQVTLGAGSETLTAARTELHLKAAAHRLRRELHEAAARHGVASTFAVVRGAAATALSDVSQRDLVVAGGRTHPIGRHFRLECRWWSAIDIAPGPLLLVRHGWRAAGAVVMLLRERSPAAARLIAAASAVAQAAERPLTVISEPAAAGAAGLDQWIGERLAGSGIGLRVEVAPADPAALHARIQQLGCTLLAVEAGDAADRGERLRAYVERFACDLLVVR